VLVACTVSGSFWDPASASQGSPSTASGSHQSVERGGEGRKEREEREERAREEGKTGGGEGSRNGGSSSSAHGNTHSHTHDSHSSTTAPSQAHHPGGSSRGGRGRSDEDGVEGLCGSAGSDGYQQSLALASAACNAVVGVSGSGAGGLAESVMDLNRPCLQAQAVEETLKGDTIQVCACVCVYVFYVCV